MCSGGSLDGAIRPCLRILPHNNSQEPHPTHKWQHRHKGICVTLQLSAEVKRILLWDPATHCNDDWSQTNPAPQQFSPHSPSSEPVHSVTPPVHTKDSCRQQNSTIRTRSQSNRARRQNMLNCMFAFWRVMANRGLPGGGLQRKVCLHRHWRSWSEIERTRMQNGKAL